MKSHFQFSNNERNGIFLLLAIIVVLQIAYWLSRNNTKELQIDTKELEAYRNEVDSLKKLVTKSNKPKVYPFNPNFISDYKGYTLGMSNAEIDRLHQFRAKGQWINSAEQFKQVTKVPDSVFEAISPFFKFPEWVSNPKTGGNSSNFSFNESSKPKPFNQKIDLNKATASQLQKVYGVGEKLSERILDYREQQAGGFHSDVELIEVYGLTPEVIERIKNHFAVKTPRPIAKLNLNTATRDQLVTIKYIDYEIANNIIEERTLREGFKNFEELTKVEDFPLKKIEIIKLYLQL